MTVLLCLAFFLSGAAGLIFESLFFRMAGLTFGSSVWASSLALSSFMGGLALGNALSIRFGNRIRRPVVFYALLEVVAGLVGCGLVVQFPGLPETFAPIFRPLLGQSEALNPLRFGMAFVLFLLPTTAMGMTLPVMVKGLNEWSRSFAKTLGKLYGWNTLGAMSGAILVEEALISHLGINGSALVAASLNGAAAAIALAVAYLAAAPRSPASPEVPLLLSRRSRRLVWAAALSGAILLALEVVWFRFLQLFILSSTRGFAVMLVVVLLGIGAGGLLSTLWLRFHPVAYRYYGHLALGAGLVTVWSYIAFEGVPQQYSGARTGDLPHMLALSLRLMLPVCLVSGVLFTFLARGVFEDCPEETRAAGWVTLFNTLGAAAGALLGGFVLLPRLGIELSFLLLALCYLGAAFLSPRDWYWPSLKKISPAWALLALLSLLTFVAFPFGLMQNHFIPTTARPYLGEDSRIAAVEEGLTETIIYVEHNYLDVPIAFQVMTNSYSMTAINLVAKRYMKLYAYWPLAFHPRVEKALLISFGVGSTAEALTSAREIEKIDVVDISRDIVEFSEVVFGAQRRSPIADPRVRVFIEDGRFYLLTTGEQYDLITAEPPPLMMAGVVNLYTQEYFDLLKRRLREGGYVTYWLPVWQLTASDALSIVKSFCNVFEDCSLWNGGKMNLMLVGSRDASTELNGHEFSRQWRDEKTATALGLLGFENPELLLTTFVADANQLAELARDLPPLIDNYPHRLGREGGRDNHYFASLLAPHALIRRYRASDYLAERLPPELRESAEAYFAYQTLIDRALIKFPKPPPLDLPALDRVLTNTNLRTVALWTLGDALETSGAIEQLVENGRIEGKVHYHLGLRLMADRRFLEAEDHFRQSQQLEGNKPNMYYFRILCFAYAGDMKRARELVAELSLSVSPGQGDEQYWSFVSERFGLER